MHFKGFCLLSILMILALGNTSAQTSFGIRGGYSISRMSYLYELGRPSIRTSGIAAPTFSFVFEHFNNKNAGVQIELQYLTLGYTQESDLGETNQTELEYLKIPFLANFYAGKSGRFHIKIGPHIGYMINATDVLREFEDPTNLPTYGGANDDPNRFMYGLTGGAGLSKLFGKSTLEGDVRFSYEFGRPEGQDRIFDMNSTNIEITLTYLFQVAKTKLQK
ncbi:Outer membrane protein beta-barrel domain-containing protein [Aquiflexum balticum DSM 16537]|uniref:Outer membrane protein beta-barrel domain-containing protein n=2 Tax=Aquiflexum TaxID=280472 RepID=A0A1W2H1N0_9BACT|nr:Outer membrane protein beta-barrel domain-containing protein [Aquiflexum balticum DSM 16537]